LLENADFGQTEQPNEPPSLSLSLSLCNGGTLENLFSTMPKEITNALCVFVTQDWCAHFAFEREREREYGEWIEL